MSSQGADHGIAWAKRLLANDNARQEMCDKIFLEEDTDKSGALSIEEVAHLIKRICSDMHIKTPAHEKVQEMIGKILKIADINKDNVLSPKEFRTAFKTTLKSCLAEAEKELAEENARTAAAAENAQASKAAAPAEDTNFGKADSQPENRRWAEAEKELAEENPRKAAAAENAQASKAAAPAEDINSGKADFQPQNRRNCEMCILQ